MMLHNKKFYEQGSRLLISGVDALAGMPVPATECALLQHSHSDLAETLSLSPCVISSSGRRDCCWEGVVPSQEKVVTCKTTWPHSVSVVWQMLFF